MRYLVHIILQEIVEVRSESDDLLRGLSIMMKLLVTTVEWVAIPN